MPVPHLQNLTLCKDLGYIHKNKAFDCWESTLGWGLWLDLILKVSFNLNDFLALCPQAVPSRGTYPVEAEDPPAGMRSQPVSLP